MLTQADLGSWFLSGSFRNRAPARHVYNVGFSYSTQRTAAANPLGVPGLERTALAGRAAGTLYGVGQVMLSRRMTIDYGARYSRYDYLGGAGLFSPSVMVTPQAHRSVPRQGRRLPAPARARCGGVPGAADLRDMGPAREDLCRLLAGGA